MNIEEQGEDFEDFGELGAPPISTEDRARAMGWKPEHEYRGHKPWTDAETFIKHGEAELPILRDQNRRMSEKLVTFERTVDTLRNTVAEQQQAIRDAMSLAKRADEAGYQRGLKELKAKQRAAAETGDVEAYDQVSEQIEAAERERAATDGFVTTKIPDPAPPSAPEPKPQEMSPETRSFIENNPWFRKNAILNRAMIDAHQQVMTDQPSLNLAEQYEAARAEVVRAFPQFFPEEYQSPPGNENDMSEPTPRPRPRLRPANLPPGSQSIRERQNVSAFDRIEDPADRKEAKDAFARVKQYDPDTTEDEYVTLYLNPKTDVLALRASRKKA